MKSIYYCDFFIFKEIISSINFNLFHFIKQSKTLFGVVQTRNCIHEDCLSNYSTDRLQLDPETKTSWGSWKTAKHCVAGALGAQFEFFWEPSQGVFEDDSGGNGFFIRCQSAVYDTNGNVNTQDLNWIGNHGRYLSRKHFASCPKGSYLFAIQVNSESDQGFFGDDMALCNVRLWCKNPIDGIETKLSESGAPSPGTWTAKESCPSFHGIAGVQLKISSYQGSDDDTMLNKIRVFCAPITTFVNAVIDNRP